VTCQAASAQMLAIARALMIGGSCCSTSLAGLAPADHRFST
jgi:hypothetical protein